MLLVDYNNFYLLGMKLKDPHSFLQITTISLAESSFPGGEMKHGYSVSEFNLTAVNKQ